MVCDKGEAGVIGCPSANRVDNQKATAGGLRIESWARCEGWPDLVFAFNDRRWIGLLRCWRGSPKDYFFRNRAYCRKICDQREQLSFRRIPSPVRKILLPPTPRAERELFRHSQCGHVRQSRRGFGPWGVARFFLSLFMISPTNKTTQILPEDRIFSRAELPK